MIKKILIITVLLFMGSGCTKQLTYKEENKKLLENSELVDIEKNTEDIISISKELTSIKDLDSKKFAVNNEKMLFINTNKYIYFDSNKYKIKNKHKLDNLIKIFKGSNIKLYLIGHTDSAGDDSYNQLLSELRAKEVYKYFIAKGFDNNKIDYIGYGEEQPIATNENAKGRKLNRRVEIIVSSTEKNAKYFIEHRKINTSYLNNHSKINAGNVEKTIKGQTKNKSDKEIEEIKAKVSLPTRPTIDINIQKRKHIINDEQ
jgi:outer membrane protein OmpA-like peptidoglycan-associated protein